MPSYGAAVSIACSCAARNAGPPPVSRVIATTAVTAVANARPIVATRHAVMLWTRRRTPGRRLRGAVPVISRIRASSASDGSGSGPPARTRLST